MYFVYVYMNRFWLGPFLILICSYGIADYQRQAFAFIVQAILIFLAHGFFFVLTRPTPGNHSFPYHVTTSKVGIVNTSTENFPHHEENRGGNVAFESTEGTIDFNELFRAKQNGDIYVVDNATVNVNTVILKNYSYFRIF